MSDLQQDGDLQIKEQLTVIKEIVEILNHLQIDVSVLCDQFTASQRDMKHNVEITDNEFLTAELDRFFTILLPYLEILKNSSRYLLSYINNLHYNINRPKDSLYIKNMMQYIIRACNHPQFKELILIISHLMLKTLNALSTSILVAVKKKEFSKNLSKYLVNYLATSYNNTNRTTTFIGYITTLLSRLQFVIRENNAYNEEVEIIKNTVLKITQWVSEGRESITLAKQYKFDTLRLSADKHHNNPSDRHSVKFHNKKSPSTSNNSTMLLAEPNSKPEISVISLASNQATSASNNTSSITNSSTIEVATICPKATNCLRQLQYMRPLPHMRKLSQFRHPLPATPSSDPRSSCSPNNNHIHGNDQKTPCSLLPSMTTINSSDKPLAAHDASVTANAIHSPRRQVPPTRPVPSTLPSRQVSQTPLSGPNTSRSSNNSPIHINDQKTPCSLSPSNCSSTNMTPNQESPVSNATPEATSKTKRSATINTPSYKPASAINNNNVSELLASHIANVATGNSNIPVQTSLRTQRSATINTTSPRPAQSELNHGNNPNNAQEVKPSSGIFIPKSKVANTPR